VLGELMEKHPEYASGRIVIHGSQVAVLRAGPPGVKHLVWPDRDCDCGCEQPARFPPIALPDVAVLAKSVAVDGAGCCGNSPCWPSGSATPAEPSTNAATPAQTTEATCSQPWA
jgi:hypothetical protein